MAASGTMRGSRPSVILVGTDLSDLDRLMPFAFEQASQTSSRLILLHTVVGSGSSAAEPSCYDPWSAVGFAERHLEPWCAEARGYGLVCDALVREGQPVGQIGAAARQFHASLILLGTRSRNKSDRMLVGSVAEQVLRSVNLPVMTVAPEAHLPVQSGFGPRLVLHATTLRETSRPSAVLACRYAARLGARLILLHVLPPIDELVRHGQPAGLEVAATRELHALADEAVAATGIEVEPRVIYGNPSIEILAEASQRHAGVIVLGAADRAAFENLARDRTVYRVLAHARCPVLTLCEPEGARPEAADRGIETFRA